MKRLLIFTVLTVFPHFASHAQSLDLHDRNIDAICGYVNTLREHPEKYMEVRDAMQEDNSWTMMSEIADSCTAETRKNLCGLRDRVERIEINDIAFQVEQARGTLPESTETFCNGNDPRYNYSFHEFKILAGKTIVSSISGGSSSDNSGRSGPQLFLIVPFNPGTIQAEIKYDGTTVAHDMTKEGYIRFVINEDVSPKDRIIISISNISDTNQSAVIINHNSRRH